MSPSEERDDEAVLAAFLVELLDDRARGDQKELAYYQSRYPGYEQAIAREIEQGAVSRSAASYERAIAAGSLAGRYRLDGEVGRGGMGVVLRAYEHNLDRRLAIKCMKAGSEAESARFIEEARVTAQLDHPGIVPVHELGVGDNGAPYFTMPLVRGRTFAQVIRDARARGDDWSSTIGVLQRVCETVAFAHDKGVVHRDLKPQNIMVGRFGEVYVMDWGVARAGSESAGRSEDASGTALADPATDGSGWDRASSEAKEEAAASVGADQSLVLTTRSDCQVDWTMQGAVMGTPAYMAPEQARGARDVDARVDVYAIGAILYHVLTGNVPYAESAAGRSSREVLDLVVSGPPDSLRDLRPEAPAELVAICEHAMHRDPDRRYQTVGELRAELAAFLEGRVVHTYERGAWPTLRKWIGRNPVAAAASATAMLSVLVGLVVSWLLMARAEGEAARANASFEASVEAVESMLQKVATDTLDGVPQATQVRRDLLAEANRLYARFRRERPDDIKVCRRAAEGCYQIASIYMRMGDTAEARAANARSLELWRHVRGMVGVTEQVEVAIVQSLHQSAVGNMTSGELDRAEQDLKRAMRRIDPLLVESRASETLDVGASIYETCALVSRKVNRHEQVGWLAKRSLAITERLVSLHGDRYRFRFGRARNLLAGECVRRKDYAGGAEQFEAAVSAFRATLTVRPTDVDVQAALVVALRNASELHRHLERTPRAIELLDEAIERARVGVRDFPAHSAMHRRLADCLQVRSRMAWDAEQHDLAEQLIREGLSQILIAVDMVPDDVGVQLVLRKVRRRLHESLRRSGDFEGALTNARKLRAAAGDHRSFRVEVASLFVECVVMLDAARLPEAAVATLRDGAAAEAVEMLRELHADTPLWQETLMAPRFDRLRDHPEFAAMQRTAHRPGK